MPTKDGIGPAGSGLRDGHGQGESGKGLMQAEVEISRSSISFGSVAKFTGSHVS